MSRQDPEDSQRETESIAKYALGQGVGGARGASSRGAPVVVNTGGVSASLEAQHYALNWQPHEPLGQRALKIVEGWTNNVHIVYSMLAPSEAKQLYNQFETYLNSYVMTISRLTYEDVTAIEMARGIVYAALHRAVGGAERQASISTRAEVEHVTTAQEGTGFLTRMRRGMGRFLGSHGQGGKDED